MNIAVNQRLTAKLAGRYLFKKLVFHDLSSLNLDLTSQPTASHS